MDNAGALGLPPSWMDFLVGARSKDYGVLPTVLRHRRELIPYLPLLFPHRFTATLAAAVDTLAARPEGPIILEKNTWRGRQTPK